MVTFFSEANNLGHVMWDLSANFTRQNLRQRVILSPKTARVPDYSENDGSQIHRTVKEQLIEGRRVGGHSFGREQVVIAALNVVGQPLDP